MLRSPILVLLLGRQGGKAVFLAALDVLAHQLFQVLQVALLHIFHQLVVLLVGLGAAVFLADFRDLAVNR